MANKNPLESTNAVVRIPLKDILADKTWNVRSAHLYSKVVEKEGDREESGTFTELVADIRMHGVQSAVVVQANPDKNTAKKHPYALVEGFRRYTASELAGLTDIPAIVKVFNSAYDARVSNMRENVNREDLKGADLAFGVGDLFKLNPSATEQAIATSIGINQSYLNKLKRIVQTLPPAVTEAWRAMPEGARVKVLDMYALVQVADKVKKGDAKQGDFDTKWKELKDKAAPKAEGGAGNGAQATKKDKLEAILGQAEALGRTVGVLASLKAVTVHANVEVWENVAKKILKVPADKTTADAMRRITSALAKGYESGKEAVEEAEEDEEAEEVNGGKRGKVAARA